MSSRAWSGRPRSARPPAADLVRAGLVFSLCVTLVSIRSESAHGQPPVLAIVRPQPAGSPPSSRPSDPKRAQAQPAPAAAGAPAPAAPQADAAPPPSAPTASPAPDAAAEAALHLPPQEVIE